MLRFNTVPVGNCHQDPAQLEKLILQSTSRDLTALRNHERFNGPRPPEVTKCRQGDNRCQLLERFAAILHEIRASVVIMFFCFKFVHSNMHMFLKYHKLRIFCMIVFFSTIKPCWRNVVGPDDLHERSIRSHFTLRYFSHPNQIPPSVPRRFGTRRS